jgi:hypothetical protein
MPLNGSGPISLAGSTAGQSIALELGLSATGQISLNDAAVRTLAGVPSGAIVMPTDFYGKSNRVTASATISSDTANYTVNTAKAPGYSSGKTDFTLTINSGVFVFSGSTGSYAMTVDTSWAAGDTVTIVNNGTIVGRGGGGGGGGGGGTYAGGSPGGGGGPALLVQRAITMNNLNRIAGGGGGGGGQGTVNGTNKSGEPTVYYGGGGGGGGIGNGSAGGGGGNPEGQFVGISGNAGTLTAAGTGGRWQTVCIGQGFGGTGGGYGAAGSSATGGGCSGTSGMGGGGSGGVCIQGNSNITYTNTGTRNGTINS